MPPQPPLEKIYEAWSALADGRVTLAENEARVTSSDRRKEYLVRWKGDEYSSNDSATYWQGYAGYPVIAALLLQGRLPWKKETAALFAGINWTELNARHKRDYARAADEILKRLEAENADLEAVKSEAAAVHAALAALPLTIRRGPLRPPKKA